MQLLDLELLDLGLSGPRADAHVMEFPEFPGMPPLDLRRGGKWQLGSEKPVLAAEKPTSRSSLEEWLTPSPGWCRTSSTLNWLCVTDDLELHLLAKSLEAAGHYEVVFTQALNDAAGRLASTKPLVVVVSGQCPSSDADFAALALRPEGVGLLVIAPHELSTRPATGGDGYLSWERQSLLGRERIAFDLSASGGGWSKVQRWMWQRFPDWRVRFLKWLERHFDKAGKDSLYSATGVQAWLDRFDPREEWFHTVSDLLSLCLSFESEKKLPREHDAQAGRQLVAALQRSKPAFIGDQLAALCLARWRCRRFAWNGALSLDDWAALTPRAPVVLGEDELNPIVQGKTVAQRKKAADALSQRLQMANPQSLLQGGLLKPVSGSYDFQHRSLVNLLVRDQLLAEIVNAPLSDWAWTCFDAERCRLGDAALDALPLKDLQALASRVAELDAFEVESIGASEAIFYAIGRRIAKGEVTSHGDAFVALARSVVARLSMDEGEWILPAPWSRSIDSEEGKLDWISACWAWSLIPAPSLAADASWLFPGWSNLLPEPPGWLTSLWPAKGVEQLPRCWQLFFQIAEQLVKQLDVPVSNVPLILKMAHLVKAAHGGWEAQPSWWDGLLHLDNIRWLDEVLVEGFGEAMPQEAAKRLWPSYLGCEAAAKTGSDAWITYMWRVRRWLLDSLPIPWAIDSLDASARVYLASCPQTLPPQWRGPLWLSLKEQWQTIPVGTEYEFLQRFGSAVANELEQLLGHGSLLGWAAANLMWEWNARSAGELLHHAEMITPEAWWELFDACPPEKLSLAISALRSHPERLSQAKRTGWVKQKLPASGGLAQPLLALLRAEG
ncbi:MAG: hypothetical protein KKB95_05385 [Gammaproteobacteria bacterium]|nr:hypothetical protein [Gammaproteobacteria bacterium]MBU1351307.1 hypothetical protein [Gammaproteobacteria bacterium]MBU1505082.1 hypothetical protein [Gammaproteobacteria bacterium]MBU1815777.1 hypothetical protein [Gammaproteobacteria bacterium]MBU2122281.1 hypothetical protein [Gammaproteobacteria bacterium]